VEGESELGDRGPMMIWALLPLLLGATWVSPVASTSLQAVFVPAEAYGSGHRGIDLSAQPGSPIRAVADGRVALAGPVAGKPVVVLVVDDPAVGHIRVTFEPVNPAVKVGDLVRAGQQIGILAGTGGHCGRPPHCLHLGLKQSGRYLNPTGFLGSGRVVLKPLR
jgi:murein DD-endopeptidase MepM/ murein hydrolase activator NlpD